MRSIAVGISNVSGRRSTRGTTRPRVEALELLIGLQISNDVGSLLRIGNSDEGKRHWGVGDARRLPPDDAVQLRPDQRLGAWSDLMADRAFGEVSLALRGVTGGTGRVAEGEKRHAAEYDIQHFHHSHTSQKLSPAGSWRRSDIDPREFSSLSTDDKTVTEAVKTRKARNFVMITHRPFAEFPWGSGHIAPGRYPCETSP